MGKYRTRGPRGSYKRRDGQEAPGAVERKCMSCRSRFKTREAYRLCETCRKQEVPMLATFAYPA